MEGTVNSLRLACHNTLTQIDAIKVIMDILRRKKARRSKFSLMIKT